MNTSKSCSFRQNQVQINQWQIVGNPIHISKALFRHHSHPQSATSTLSTVPVCCSWERRSTFLCPGLCKPCLCSMMQWPQHSNLFPVSWAGTGLSLTVLTCVRPIASFFDNGAKLSHLVGLLRGKTLAWAEAYFSFHPIISCLYVELLGELTKTFTHPVSEGSVANY